MAEMNGAEALVRTLKQNNIDTIFSGLRYCRPKMQWYDSNVWNPLLFAETHRSKTGNNRLKTTFSIVFYVKTSDFMFSEDSVRRGE